MSCPSTAPSCPTPYVARTYGPSNDLHQAVADCKLLLRCRRCTWKTEAADAAARHAARKQRAAAVREAERLEAERVHSETCASMVQWLMVRTEADPAVTVLDEVVKKLRSLGVRASQARCRLVGLDTYMLRILICEEVLPGGQVSKCEHLSTLHRWLEEEPRLVAAMVQN